MCMRVIRKILLVLGGLIAAGVLAFLAIAFFLAQRADYGWNPGVDQPAFVKPHPTVLFDEGHNNSSRIGFTGRYWPFARLLRADGCRVIPTRGKFSRGSLKAGSVLVIANATGAPKPQFFGINLPVDTRG